MTDLVNCTTTCLLVTSLLSLLVFYVYRHFTKLQRYGIKGPTPLPFIGNLHQQMSMGNQVFVKKHFEKYGKIFGYYIGYKPAVMVADAEVLKLILVKDFANFMDRSASSSVPRLLQNGLFFMQGRQWKRTRNIISPTFSASKLKLMTSTIGDQAEKLGSILKKHSGQTVNIKDILGRYTLDSVAGAAFGLDTECQENHSSPIVTHLQNIFMEKKFMKLTALLAATIPGIGKLLYRLGVSFWPISSVDYLERVGKGLIAERKEKDVGKMDFIQLLLKAEFDETRQEYIHQGATLSNGESSSQKQKVSRLDDDTINAQAFSVFLGGYETTASTLSFALYALALHPEIDRKLYEEMEQELGDEEATYTNVAKLKYMEQFVNEVLRFYPPLTSLMRVTREDQRVDDKVIPKGCQITIPVYHIHHSEEFYSDPETFNPDRFGGDSKVIDSVTFLPFGFGPRHCIGMRFAYSSVKMALVHILRNVRLAVSEETQVPLDLKMVVLLSPKKPIKLKIESRFHTDK